MNHAQCKNQTLEENTKKEKHILIPTTKEIIPVDKLMYIFQCTYSFMHL